MTDITKFRVFAVFCILIITCQSAIAESQARSQLSFEQDQSHVRELRRGGGSSSSSGDDGYYYDQFAMYRNRGGDVCDIVNCKLFAGCVFCLVWCSIFGCILYKNKACSKCTKRKQTKTNQECEIPDKMIIDAQNYQEVERNETYSSSNIWMSTLGISGRLSQGRSIPQ